MDLRAAVRIIPVGLVMVMLFLPGCGKEKPEDQALRNDVAEVETLSVRPQTGQLPPTSDEARTDTDLSQTRARAGADLPRLVDLGRGTCIPCKAMAPILEELRVEYEGRAVVEVIDLRDQGEAAMEYRIRVIPTQIFFDPEGNEVWRHEGFLSKQEIIARFTEMGVPPVGD